MTEDIPRTCWYSGRRCPNCGSPLITNGRHIWCSFVSIAAEDRCGFGVDERVPSDPPEK